MTPLRRGTAARARHSGAMAGAGDGFQVKYVSAFTSQATVTFGT